MNNSKTIKVALFVIVVIGIMLAGIPFLKGRGLFKKTITLYAVYDKVEVALNPSDPIVVKGIPIGRVTYRDLIVEGPNKGRVLVMFDVDPKYPIPKGSLALLDGPDLLGEITVQVAMSKNTEFLADGDTIETKIKPSMFEELGGQITPLTDRIDATLDNVNNLFSEELNSTNDATINELITSINTLATTYNDMGKNLNNVLVQQNKNLNAVLGNLEKLSADLANETENISGLLANLNQFSGDLNNMELAETISSANQALTNLNTVLETVNSSQGTVGALMNERKLYDELNVTMENLNVVLEDFYENPNRYVSFSLIERKDKSQKKKNK